MQPFFPFSDQNQNSRMKRFFKLLPHFLFFCLLMILGSGCMKDKITQTFKISTPIYEVLTKFRETVKTLPATEFENPGKITVFNNYIFLSEPFKGIHVINNINPAAPKNVAFINIPGNEDLAIRGNTLYADAYSDLVSFDISDPLHAVAKNFLANVFPDHNIYYMGGMYAVGAYVNPDSVNVIVGWYTRDTTVDYNPGQGGYIYSSSCPTCVAVPNMNGAVYAASAAGVPKATNGSMARFGIIYDYLYTVGYSSLTSFDISKPMEPAFSSTVSVDFHVETIFPFQDKLFVGTNNGMFMYDVKSSPSKPSLLGSLAHTRGCDPVISDGDYAYVTLNDSSACLGFNNELQVISIQDLANPVLVKSYPLTHPVGLSKDGNHLFLCDGKAGLKIYDATDVTNLQLIKQFPDGEFFDVIAENGLAVVMARDGIYQYDYSDISNIHLISKL
jgi:hypothetical protein